HPVPPVQHPCKARCAALPGWTRSGGAARPCRLSVLSAQPQRSPVEGDRLLDMAVPVVPRVRAGELGVFVRDAELLEVAMEGAVFLQEPILQSAVDTEGGEEPAVDR